MVIVRLLGGLGNQLFQYAAARRIALKNQLPLKLDITGFDSYGRRPYCLHHFNIAEEFATQEEIRRLRVDRVRRVLARFLGIAHVGTHFEECHFHYDPRVSQISSKVYLSGYWQSEKYFADVADVVRAEFTVKTPATPENAATQSLIESCNSVCIHVRRGDYVANWRARQTHGVCSVDYYRLAVSEMVSRLGDAHFFVFSDDPRWTRDNISFPPRSTFVNHNGADRGHEDLRLMAKCRHHIIANSTFSWWGAWLGTAPGQIVMAPRRWFVTNSTSARDVCPAHWLRL
jgi:hypothetical protein